MPGVGSDAEGQYSAWVGLVFIFNLIVGTGALTIPAAFSHAGWLASTVIIFLLAFMSYMTSTFVIEAMAAANAILQWQKIKRRSVANTVNQPLPSDSSDSLNVSNNVASGSSEDADDEEDEQSHLLQSGDSTVGIAMTLTDFYSIQKRIEMGQMATMFFNKAGQTVFYVIICVYLFGDLAIYNAAIAKSLRDTSCAYVSSDNCTIAINDTEACWYGSSLSRVNVYRMYVAITFLFLGPFAFFNVQKTKVLQVTTSLLRWIAFSTMVILSIVHLITGKGAGNPPVVKFSGIPNLFGVCVYSFMCHHSLPSLVTPIKNKAKVFTLFAVDYLLILFFYLLLATTAIFSFANVQDLYTLNFLPSRCNSDSNPDIVPGDIPVIQYFLALFPVFTLSTNFPIIAITLRNNLKSLFLQSVLFRNTRCIEKYQLLVENILFPLIAIIPPAVIAISTQDVQFLVGVTGSFAGANVQYVIPALLVICSRKESLRLIGLGVKNSHRSPFYHRGWTFFTLGWTLLCLTFIIVNYCLKGII